MERAYVGETVLHVQDVQAIISNIKYRLKDNSKLIMPG